MSDTEQPTDRELRRRAVGGEPEAFGVLFDRYAEPVRGYCARRTGSLEFADDLVSVVFLEARRRRDDVELLGASALPWLYGIANHTVRRRWRTATRHRRALERLAAFEDSAPDHAADVARRSDDRRELDRMHRALRRLRRSDQEVITLCLLQGLDYESAALVLDVPPSAPCALGSPVPAVGCGRRSTHPSGSRRPARTAAPDGDVMSSTLTPMEPERHRAVRAVLVAEAGRSSAPPTVHARRPAVRRAPYGLVAAAAAVSGTVLLTGDPTAPPDYGSWTALPETGPGLPPPPSGDLQMRASQCTELTGGGVAVDGVPPTPDAAAGRDVLVDRRGDYVYCLDVAPGSGTAADPLVALAGIRSDDDSVQQTGGSSTTAR